MAPTSRRSCSPICALRNLSARRAGQARARGPADHRTGAVASGVAPPTTRGPAPMIVIRSQWGQAVDELGR